MKQKKNRPKVMVNVLQMGSVCTGLELQLWEWMREKVEDYEFTYFTPQARPISNNRNQIVKQFLEGDWDYLFMLDDDNPPFPGKNVFDLLDCDKDVIAAVCPGRDDRGIHFHVYKLHGELDEGFYFSQYPPKERRGIQKVDAVSTGCIFIKRHVLEGMKAPFEDIFDEDGILVTSDDMGFCFKCREKGVDVYAHWGYLCSHFKRVDLAQMANLIVRAAKSGEAKLSINRPIVRDDDII